MKISKDRLKQLISEELSIGFGTYGPDDGGHEETSYDKDGRMAKQNLWKMAEYARELYELIDDDEDLEPWVEEKIAIASFMMDSVGHYMQYEKHRAHEEGEGEEDHFEIDLGSDEESDDEDEMVSDEDEMVGDEEDEMVSDEDSEEDEYLGDEEDEEMSDEEDEMVSDEEEEYEDVPDEEDEESDEDEKV